MGCNSSKPVILSAPDGDEDEYKSRYEEGGVLGEGEFGVVKLVTDRTTGSSYASKILRKGFVFKDNELYAPQPPHEVKRECEILRTLGGRRYTMRLLSLYEGRSCIYMVTEVCGGGEMLEYVTGAYPEGIRSEDVSRIAHQLLTAVDHCAKHSVIHRDIKPENIMFTKKQAGPASEVRLIDFGCSKWDGEKEVGDDDGGVVGGGDGGGVSAMSEHHTFAGTAFYISPEMFAKTYTIKTDVWSVGVTLYVLVAGYPSEKLQRAFNLLQKSKRDLRTLPGMPDNMPETYFEMLDGLLRYAHKKRRSAGDMLKCEFVQFHKQLEDEKGGGGRRRNGSIRRTGSVLFKGSTDQHRKYKSYQKFERALTTVLATVPTGDELDDLIRRLGERRAPAVGTINEDEDEEEDDEAEQAPEEDDSDRAKDVSDKLQVVKVGELKGMLRDMKLEEAADTVDGLPASSDYDSYAYHVSLLREFARLRRRADGYRRGMMAGTPNVNEDGEEEGGEVGGSVGPPKRGMGGGGMGMMTSMRDFGKSKLGGGGGGGLGGGTNGASSSSYGPPARGLGRKAMSVFM